MGVRMTHSVSAAAEHEAELASIARMLAHIRDSARALDAQALEYCIDMALQAVANELRDRRDFAGTGADLAGGCRLLQ
ncbi:hypothetical protein AU381_22295 [Sinorhizobium glycinis]|uniref:Uncharacterized protein n=1 Tax=Sinorhizobium glycinis TaxID=1472378 RepID=A0A178XSR0_9HYPH|nr:hypothetical protein [Sinorhizobium glycinis]OAP38309.1 hypothetical protein AU381_22295 [Sinorhizobium glycinis]